MPSSNLARTFGHVPPYMPGHTFRNRQKLFDAGVHGQTQAGIFGNTEEGAYSICMSGGYEDDNDRGDRITYVGAGGRNDSGVQVQDQSENDPANQALIISSQTGRPVRVIRGEGDYSHYAPALGYRYDGLYVVHSYVMKPGKRGFMVCFFELRRQDEGEGINPLEGRRTLTSKKMDDMLKDAKKKGIMGA